MTAFNNKKKICARLDNKKKEIHRVFSILSYKWCYAEVHLAPQQPIVILFLGSPSNAVATSLFEIQTIYFPDDISHTQSSYTTKYFSNSSNSNY